MIARSGCNLLRVVLIAGVCGLMPRPLFALDPPSPNPANVPGGRNQALAPLSHLEQLQTTLAGDKARQTINPDLFRDFWTKWKLVTTRYKSDGEELRFIYANDLGAQTFTGGAYPFQVRRS